MQQALYALLGLVTPSVGTEVHVGHPAGINSARLFRNDELIDVADPVSVSDNCNVFRARPFEVRHEVQTSFSYLKLETSNGERGIKRIRVQAGSSSGGAKSSAIVVVIR